MGNIFLETDFRPEPLAQFQAWFAEYLKTAPVEPYAMQIATSRDNLPKVRTVSVGRDISHGLSFFTNLESPKAKDIENNPFIQAQFFWNVMGRQIRISGVLVPLPRKVCEQIFSMQPRQQKIVAHVTALFGQSSVVTQAELDIALKDLKDKFIDEDFIPMPSSWGGFSINAKSWEFWQSDSELLHKRVNYQVSGDTWSINQLTP